MEIKSRNTNTVAPVTYNVLDHYGVMQDSRNGLVLRIPEPVTFHISHPWERVNFCPHRDANPFFHLIEALAMLAGLNSVKVMSYFAKQMLEYSDDGETYNAFYGTRLRTTFGINQLKQIVGNLVVNRNSRQEVALIWDPSDLIKSTKDKACNLALIFSIVDDQVVMTSLNRSNDAIWGIVTGANMVHLSFFHEYVACSLGLPMGMWYHFTNNLHVYVNNPKWEAVKNAPACNEYGGNASSLFHLFAPSIPTQEFDEMLFAFVSSLADAVGKKPMCCSDFGGVPLLWDAAVMYNAYFAYKQKEDPNAVIEMLTELNCDDWKIAAINWVVRRIKTQ